MSKQGDEIGFGRGHSGGMKRVRYQSDGGMVLETVVIISYFQPSKKAGRPPTTSALFSEKSLADNVQQRAWRNYHSIGTRSCCSRNWLARRK